MSRVGIITGLLVESKALHRAENRLPSYETPLLCAVAGDAARAYAQACAMADRGVSGLVSFGMAGGLDPALQPGDLIIAESVMDASGKSSNTDSDWRETCKSSINTARFAASPINRRRFPPITRALLIWKVTRSRAPHETAICRF